MIDGMIDILLLVCNNNNNNNNKNNNTHFMIFVLPWVTASEAVEGQVTLYSKL